jgi:hypothetical protein
MSDFLSMYSLQHWLESCPQGYLEGTTYGHDPDSREPELLMQDDLLREQAIRTTVQLVVGERCALAASSGLINACPDQPSARFLATQTLDEARHVEIFTQRLLDLGVKKNELESVIQAHANPNLVKFAEILLEKVDKKDFVSGVVGQNIVLEGMAFTVFELLHQTSQALNPKFAKTPTGTIADERRHVGFGENRIGSLIKENPGKKPEVEKMQQEMSYYMLATFADSFRRTDAREEIRRAKEQAGAAGPVGEGAEFHGHKLGEMDPEEMEALLADTVLKEFKTRLGRIGIDYQTPARP